MEKSVIKSPKSRRLTVLSMDAGMIRDQILQNYKMDDPPDPQEDLHNQNLKLLNSQNHQKFDGSMNIVAFRAEEEH